MTVSQDDVTAALSDWKRSGLGELGFVQRIRRSLESVDLPQPPRVLIGYSGGADSLALLAALSELARLGVMEVQAVHVDHGVRARSAEDAAQAVQIAATLGVECEVQRVPPEAVERHRGIGQEEALRRERYAALARAGDAWQADAIALAHHQRDQAETVLLHLLRGAGLQGASGMQVLTTLPVPWWTSDQTEPGHALTVWRPLLTEPYAEVLAFVEQIGVPVLHDETNKDRSYRRNAVRHELLPTMERVSPGSTANIARFAELAAADNAALDEVAATVLTGEGEADSATLSSRIDHLPRGIQRRVVRRWVTEHVGQNDVSLDRIDAVLDSLLDPSSPRKIELGDGWSVTTRRGQLTIEPPDTTTSE